MARKTHLRRKVSGPTTWKTAGLVALLVPLILAGTVILVVEAVDAKAANQGMEEAQICAPPGLQEKCLERASGTAEATFGRRSSSWDWRFRPSSLASEREVEVVSFAPNTEARLEGLEEIEALYWDDKLVAFYDPVTQAVIPSQEFGVRGWVLPALGAICMAGAAWITVLAAMRKRRMASSWWVRPPAESLSVLMCERVALGPLVVLLGSGAALVALVCGASVTAAAAAGGGLAVLLLGAQLRR